MSGNQRCGLIEGGTYLTNHTGDLLVVKVHNNYEVEVRFLVSGDERVVEAKDVRSGVLRDKMYPSCAGVGYLGYGRHKVSDKSSQSAYIIWRGMITRCYSQKSLNYPHYGAKGVSVCVEWFNFQTFADWYYDNHPNDGKTYHLDKDGLHTSDGPKVYSPETCQFITPSENYALQFVDKND